MSSFVRRMQRARHRRHYKPGKGIGVFYMGRGSKLGVPKMSEALKRTRRKAKPARKTATERAAIHKARVAHTYRAPTRAERAEAHRNEMAYEKGRRPPKGSGRTVDVPANLSRNHPDYGCTPAEHARRKAERNG